MKLFTLSITTPEETIFSGETDSIVLPVVDGKLEVLADHAPCIAVFSSGSIKINGKELAIANGYLKVEKNIVQLFPEDAHWISSKT